MKKNFIHVWEGEERGEKKEEAEKKEEEKKKEALTSAV